MSDIDIHTIKKHTIYEVKHGSQAYGTALPDSDLDVRGVCLIPDKRLYYGMQTFEQQEGGWEAIGDVKDKTVFHLPKFMKLAAAANPNVLELLFVREEDIVYINQLGYTLRENRNLFLSQKVVHTFSGYAISQLHRLKAHKRWLDKAPTKPTQEDFIHNRQQEVGPLGLSLGTNSFVEKIQATERPEWFVADIRSFDKEAYELAKREWENYESWRKKS